MGNWFSDEHSHGVYDRGYPERPDPDHFQQLLRQLTGRLLAWNETIQNMRTAAWTHDRKSAYVFLHARLEEMEKELHDLNSQFRHMQQQRGTAGTRSTFTGDGTQSTFAGDGLSRHSDSGQVRGLQVHIQKLNDERKILQDKVNELSAQVRQLNREADKTQDGSEYDVQALTNRMRSLETKLSEAVASKQHALDRLSEVSSQNLRVNNPAVSDLSDGHRSTNVAEQYSELYSNEWTEAFERLFGKIIMSEEETIHLLASTMKNVYDMCVSLISEHRQKLEDTVRSMVSSKMDGTMLHTFKLRTSVTQHVDNLIKAMACDFIPVIYKKYSSTYFIGAEYERHIITYVQRCVHVCTFMSVQKPSMVLLDTVVPGAPFDPEVFRPYTRSGHTIGCIVWFPLLLHKDGPLMCKGIAQGR